MSKSITLDHIRQALWSMGISDTDVSRVEITPNEVTVQRRQRDDEGKLVVTDAGHSVFIEVLPVTRETVRYIGGSSGQEAERRHDLDDVAAEFGVDLKETEQ